MVRGLLVFTTCLSTFVSSAGCSGAECGTGTVRYGDQCVAIDPFDRTPPSVAIDPPLYTRAVGTVRLTADEPATIYYTIDGSQPTFDSPNEPDQIVIPNVADDAQLRYFAVDLSGNQSDEFSHLWVIDREGPGAPLDFGVEVLGTTRTVTWTPPPDPRLGGVLVARVEGYLSSPISGQTYAVGDTLGPGVTIVDLKAAEVVGASVFTENAPVTPGMIRYAAWAYDNIHNYGPPASKYQLVAIPPQLGQITVDAATETVGIAMAPPDVTLSGSASLVGTNLTVTLSVRNNTSRALFSPKVVVTNALGGVTWTNSDGDVGAPYRAYGAAILSGTATSRTFTFTGVGPTDVVTLDVDIRDNHILTTTARNTAGAGTIVDAVTGEVVLTLAAGPLGPNGGSMAQHGGITPDGRMILGSRTTGTVSSYDLSTGSRLLTTTLQGQKSHVPQVAVVQSGSMAFALVATDHPNRVQNEGGSDTFLVRIDTATLAEGGRLALGRSRNRDIQIAPDERTLLISTGVTSQGVIVVDLGSFTIKSRILPGFRVQSARYSPDGTKIALVGESIALYDAPELTTGSVYPTPGTVGGTGKVMRAAWATDDLLWISRQDEIARVDVRDGSSLLVTATSGRMLEVFDDKLYVGGRTGGPYAVKRLTSDGVVEATLPGFTNFRGHWIGRSPF